MINRKEIGATNAPENPRSLEEILDITNQAGSPKLDTLNKSERQKVLKWFMDHFKTEADKDTIVSYTEEFIAYELISDEQCLEIVVSLPDQQQKMIGIAIGESQNPTLYVQTFYECWNSLRYLAPNETKKRKPRRKDYQDRWFKKRKEIETQQLALQQRFIERFTVDEPEMATMVAPFVDLRSIVTRKEKTQWGSTKDVKLMEDIFNSKDGWEELFNATLTFLERQSSNGRRSPKHETFVGKDRWERDRQPYLRLNEQSSTEYLLVLPYLERAKALGIVDEKFEKHLKAKLDNLYIPIRSENQMLTKAENRRMKELGTNIQAQEYEQLAFMVPRNLAMERLKLEERATNRAADLVTTYEAPSLENMKASIIHYATESINILRHPDRLFKNGKELLDILHSFSEEEYWVLLMLNPSDAANLFDYAKKTNVANEVEDVLINAYKYFFEKQDMTSSLNKFILRIDEWKPIFSAKSMENLLSLIDAKYTFSWAINIESALNRGLSLREITHSATTHSQNYELLNQYPMLRYAVVHHGDAESPPLSLTEFNEAFKQIFDRWPHILGTKKGRQTAKEIYHSDEYTNRLNEYLDSLTTETLSSLLNNYVDLPTDIYPELLEIIKANPTFLVAVRSNISEIKFFQEHITREETIEAFITHASVEKLKKLFEDREWIHPFLEVHGHERVRERFIKQHDVQSLATLLTLLHEFVAPTKNMGDEISSIQKEIDYLDSSIESRIRVSTGQYTTQRSRDDIALNIKQDQKRKAHLFKKLEKLQSKNDPAQLDAESIVELKALSRETKTWIETACEEEPELAFVGDIVTNEHLNLEEVVKQHLPAYLQLHPTELLRKRNYSSNFYLKFLGEKKFEELFEVHKMALAFGSEFWTASLPQKYIAQLEEMNPIQGALNTELERDYYQHILVEIQNSPFFFLFDKKLKDLAQKAHDLHGEKRELRRNEANPTFVSLASRVLILQRNETITKYQDRILSISTEYIEETLESLEYLIVRGQESIVEKTLATSLDDEKLLLRLHEHIADNTAPRLGLKKLEKKTLKDLSIQSLKALAIYYETRVTKTPELLDPLQTMTTKLFEGSYYEWRTWGQDQEPESIKEKLAALEVMQEQGLLPKSMTLKQYEAWNDDAAEDFDQVLQTHIKDIRHGIQDILSDAIADHHITDETLELNEAILQSRKQKLIEPMRRLTEEKKILDKRFAAVRIAKKKGKTFEPITTEEEERHKELKIQISNYRQDKADQLNEIEALLYLSALKNISSKDLERNVVTIKNAEIPLSKVFQLLSKSLIKNHPEFAQDLSRMQQTLMKGREEMFGGKTVSRSQLSLTDKVDFETYLHIGEKPVPSCQNYASTGFFNSGLLAFLTDPNIRIIQMRDENGEIIARSALRLLSDDQGQPHIFMERVYSTNAHEKIKEAMAGIALKKAESMGARLFTREVDIDLKKSEEEYHLETQPISTIRLHSYGTRSSEVYTDAGGGIKIGGKFFIDSPKELAV